MRVTCFDVLVLCAEIAVYVAVAGAAWIFLPRLAWAAAGAVGAVLAMAAWWGLFHSPKASVQLTRPLDLTLRVTWFGVGLLAAIGAVAGPSA